MMPPVSKFLIEHLTPEQRRLLAAWNLDLSLYLTPFAVAGVLINPVVGMIILMIVSFYAITITGLDALFTSDVREEQDNA